MTNRYRQFIQIVRKSQSNDWTVAFDKIMTELNSFSIELCRAFDYTNWFLSRLMLYFTVTSIQHHSHPHLTKRNSKRELRLNVPWIWHKKNESQRNDDNSMGNRFVRFCLFRFVCAIVRVRSTETNEYHSLRCIVQTRMNNNHPPTSRIQQMLSNWNDPTDNKTDIAWDALRSIFCDEHMFANLFHLQLFFPFASL